MRITSQDLIDTLTTGVVAGLAGAALAFGIMHKRAILPVAVLSGISVAVARLTKPIFDEMFGTRPDLKCYLGRVLHIALAIGCGVGAAALLGLTIASIPTALLITVTIIGSFALLGYCTGIKLPTVIAPDFNLHWTRA